MPRSAVDLSQTRKGASRPQAETYAAEANKDPVASIALDGIEWAMAAKAVHFMGQMVP